MKPGFWQLLYLVMLLAAVVLSKTDTAVGEFLRSYAAIFWGQR
jgi:hypothetical protein